VLGAAFAIERSRVIARRPGGALQAELIDLCDARRVQLIVTSGGTGLAPRDRTPQATSRHARLRSAGHRRGDARRIGAIVKTAMLSRAIAGVRGPYVDRQPPGQPESRARNARRGAARVAARARFARDGAVKDG
jgi:molybdopterin biosynthesis enzyme MoaB